MKNKLAVSMLLIIVLATIPIALRVEHVYASPSGPSLVVDDSINRVNATLGVMAGSVITAKGVIKNIGPTTLTDMLVGVYFIEGGGGGGALPADFSFEYSLDGIVWIPIIADTYVAKPAAWPLQVEQPIGQAGGETLGPGASFSLYLRITFNADLDPVKDIWTPDLVIQSMQAWVYQDLNLNRQYDGPPEYIYSQPPYRGGAPGANWDYPVKIDISIVHTAEIEGTGEFYYSIQDAVNAASSTIILYPGTYAPFTVSGNSSLTIVANGAVVVQGSQSVATYYGNRDAVIFVTGSTDITLDGLDIEGLGLGTTNPKSYAIIYESSSGTIKDCVVSPNTIGNVNGVGIAAWDHSDLVIDPCLIQNFGRIGVFFYNGCTGGVYDSTIEGQIYNDENLVNYGIEIEPWDDPCDVEILGNDIYNCDNTYPSPSWSSAGIVIDGWVAYYDLPSSTVVMSCNDIYNNYYGIEVVANPYSYAHYNNIYNNREYGAIEDSNSSGNNVNFDARYNWWGDATGPYNPTLNSGGLGNDVSDYVSFSPWLLAEKIPPLVHDVAITEVTASPKLVPTGTTVHISVTTKNEGNTYESFTVTVTYGTHVKTESITDLQPGGEITFTYNWDTTGVSPGVYQIKASASIVPGETDTIDNEKSTTVKIGPPPLIKVEPPVFKAQMLNKTFTINITMNDLWEGWRAVGVGFRLCYNDALLEVVSVTEGPFMEDPRWNLYGTFFIPIVEKDPIYGPNVLVGIALLPNDTGYWTAFPSGSGVLATITFKTIYQERGYSVIGGYIKPPLTCNLTLTDTLIIDDELNEILHTSQNGLYKMYPTNVADINWDYKVDIKDILLVAKGFGETSSRPRWNPTLDVNGDGKVDIKDIFIVARNYGWAPTYDP